MTGVLLAEQPAGCILPLSFPPQPIASSRFPSFFPHAAVENRPASGGRRRQCCAYSLTCVCCGVCWCKREKARRGGKEIKSSQPFRLPTCCQAGPCFVDLTSLVTNGHYAKSKTKKKKNKSNGEASSMFSYPGATLNKAINGESNGNSNMVIICRLNSSFVFFSLFVTRTLRRRGLAVPLFAGVK